MHTMARFDLSDPLGIGFLFRGKNLHHNLLELFNILRIFVPELGQKPAQIWDFAPKNLISKKKFCFYFFIKGGPQYKIQKWT